MNEMFRRTYTEEEVKCVLSIIGPDKAPRLDGNGECWSFIRTHLYTSMNGVRCSLFFSRVFQGLIESRKTNEN